MDTLLPSALQAAVAETASRLVAAHPDALVLYLTGSWARGEAGPYSDVDLTLVVDRPRRVNYVTFWPRVEGRPCHLSIDIISRKAFLAKEARPASWSYGLPGRQVIRAVWSESPAWAHRTALATPAAQGQLEDFIECAGKVRNAAQAGDELALRAAARSLAERWPALVAPLNEPVAAVSPLDALRCIRSFSNPPGGVAAFEACLGQQPLATAQEVAVNAMFLTRITLGLLQEALANGNRLKWLGPPDLRPQLAEGVLHQALGL